MPYAFWMLQKGLDGVETDLIHYWNVQFNMPTKRELPTK